MKFIYIHCTHRWTTAQTKKKVGIHWDSTSVIYRYREGLWLSQERRAVQYSHWTWNIYEIS